MLVVTLLLCENETVLPFYRRVDLLTFRMWR